jgi:iron complex transport system ATP-binding protein
MKQAVLRIRDLSFFYEKSKVLESLSFSVEDNGFFIIIGPNGSGKSTLLKLMAGLINPVSGQVEVLGKSVGAYKRKALAKILGLVPQTTSMDFPFTVMDVVLMGRSPHLGMLGLEREEDIHIAMQALKFTGVDALSSREMGRLSGGERQRVCIARAICQDPKIILLDEPTASLDLAHQIRVMDLMEKLQHEKGITIVMVSHDINLAAMYADTLLILKDGRIVDSGPPRDVITFKTLEQTYGCTLLVDESPLGNYPRVTQVPGKYLKTPNKTVHYPRENLNDA